MFAVLLAIILGLLTIVVLFRCLYPHYLPASAATLISMDYELKNIITGVMIFKKKLEWEKLTEVMERFSSYKQFRSLVCAPEIGWPYYKEFPQFQLSQHMKRARLPAPGNKQILEQTVASYMELGLDPSKPLWEVILFDGYYPEGSHENNGEGGSVLLVRLHHCLADGMLAVRLLLSQCTVDDAEWKKVTVRVPRRRDFAKLNFWQRFKSSFIASMKIIFTNAEEVSHCVTKSVSGKYVASWSSEALDLSEIKRVASRYGASVNDVLFSSMSAAMENHVLATTESTSSQKGLSLFATVTVSLRPVTWMTQKPEVPRTLDIQVGSVTLKLPVMHTNPVQRLKEVTKSTMELLGTAEPLVVSFFLNALGLVPFRFVSYKLWDQLASRISFNMSNVPGPQYPVKLAGEEIDQLVFFTTPIGKLGTFVCILSYNGKVSVGCTSCKKVIERPEAVVERFHEEFRLLSQMSE